MCVSNATFKIAASVWSAAGISGVGFLTSRVQRQSPSCPHAGLHIVMCKAVRAERLIKWAELKQHASPTDLWVAVNGKAYDLTAYQKVHPGSALILQHVGGEVPTRKCCKESCPSEVAAGLSMQYTSRNGCV